MILLRHKIVLAQRRQGSKPIGVKLNKIVIKFMLP